MLEAASCSHIHLVETPRVDGPTLQALKALLGGRVAQHRHHAVLGAGGADEGSHESDGAPSSICFILGRKRPPGTSYRGTSSKRP